MHDRLMKSFVKQLYRNRAMCFCDPDCLIEKPSLELCAGVLLIKSESVYLQMKILTTLNEFHLREFKTNKEKAT